MGGGGGGGGGGSLYHLCLGVIYVAVLMVMMMKMSRVEARGHERIAAKQAKIASTIALPLYHRDDPASPLRKMMVGKEQEEEEQRVGDRVNMTRMFTRDERRVESINKRVGVALLKVEKMPTKQHFNDNFYVSASHGDPHAYVSASHGDPHVNLTTSHTSTGPNNVNVSTPVTTGLPDGSGEFFTTIGVGYRDFLLVMDTGSDLVWLQCLPCLNCYEQMDPLFNPAASSTFSSVNCASAGCSQAEIMTCRGQLCQYQQSYGDGSFTVGSMVRENFYVNGLMIQAGILMGCGHDNEGLFVGAAGLLGLGRGPLSLPSQLSPHTGGIFSYCLSSTGPGALILGHLDQVDATAQNPNHVYTPLLRNPLHDLTYYYVPLIGISIQGRMVPGVRPSDLSLRPSGRGGVILDSGTTITRLIAPAYYAMRDAFRQAASMRGYMLPRVYSLFDTCYLLPLEGVGPLPTIELHFQGGSPVSLPIQNIMYPIDDEVPLLCLAFAPSSADFSILGNIQQQGFLITFDTAASRVGFLSNQCSPSPSY